MVTNDKVDLMLCVFCGEERMIHMDYCRQCFMKYKEFIESSPAWLNALRASHQKERRRAKREQNISLDAIIENMTKHRFL